MAAAKTEKDALEFYLKCYREINFTRNDAKGSEWREWEERNERRLESDGYALALQLQLKYLILTLQVHQAEDLGPLIPDILTYLDTIGKSLEDLGQWQDMLRRPVTSSVFAQAYLLDKSLNLKDWDASPLNLPGLFGKTIIPYLKKENPSQVASAWDRRISFEQQLVAIEESPALEREFTEETLPSLYWEKSVDMFDAGFQSVAIQSMMDIARKNPRHPSALEWVRIIKDLLVKAAYPDGPPPTPEASPDPEIQNLPVSL